MNIDALADKARRSISRFCIEECKAYCCRKGYLMLTETEADSFFDNKQDLIESKSIKKTKDGYSLAIGINDEPCPKLSVYFRCDIHSGKDRPMMCLDFPIFILPNKKIRISGRCLAAKNNMFYGFEAEFIKLGFKLV